jgi:hypothetical protein
MGIFGNLIKSTVEDIGSIAGQVIKAPKTIADKMIEELTDDD